MAENNRWSSLSLREKNVDGLADGLDESDWRMLPKSAWRERKRERKREREREGE